MHKSMISHRNNRTAMSSIPSSRIRNMSYQNQSRVPVDKKLLPQQESTTASTLSTISVIQEESVSSLTIVLICIIVLLSIVIIVLVSFLILRRKKNTSSQNRSTPLTDSQRGYVAPNKIGQGQRKAYLIQETNLCKNCRQTISEETGNEAHDYIDMQHSPIEPIPEVIYHDPNTPPDVMPNVKIYDDVESKAKDLQTMSNENSNMINLYHVVEP